VTTTKCCIYQLVGAWPSRGGGINERFEWRTLRISISTLLGRRGREGLLRKLEGLGSENRCLHMLTSSLNSSATKLRHMVFEGGMNFN